jgi:hypothetical protein
VVRHSLLASELVGKSLRTPSLRGTQLVRRAGRLRSDAAGRFGRVEDAVADAFPDGVVRETSAAFLRPIQREVRPVPSAGPEFSPSQPCWPRPRSRAPRLLHRSAAWRRFWLTRRIRRHPADQLQPANHRRLHPRRAPRRTQPGRPDHPGPRTTATPPGSPMAQPLHRHLPARPETRLRAATLLRRPNLIPHRAPFTFTPATPNNPARHKTGNPVPQRNPIQTAPPASRPNGEISAKTPNRSRDISGAIFFGQFLERFTERPAGRGVLRTHFLHIAAGVSRVRFGPNPLLDFKNPPHCSQRPGFPLSSAILRGQMPLNASSPTIRD